MKAARTVWSGGKAGDNIKRLPITIDNMEYGCDENYRKEVINLFGNERTYLKNLEEIYKIFALFDIEVS